MAWPSSSDGARWVGPTARPRSWPTSPRRASGSRRPQARLPKRIAPPWLGDAELHRSHQSALVRKDPTYYRQFFPDVPDDLPYVWPVTSKAR